MTRESNSRLFRKSNGKPSDPRISLVHYWLFSMRGGEQVIHNISRSIPISRAYALCGIPEEASHILPNVPVTWSPLQKIPGIKGKYRKLLPLFPWACSQVKMNPCDIVISSESGPAKAFKCPSNALHICYCHTPMRYLWSHYHEYLNTLSGIQKLAFKLFVPWLRRWDKQSAKSVDHFIANSRNVADRIAKYYNREAKVIHPPVRYDMFQPIQNRGDYYLVVSALVEYKRIDIAVEAFNTLGLPLKIAGDGPDFGKLSRLAGPNIELLGRPSDKDLVSLYAGAKAFVFPTEEDFGITPLEAQASGTPVIALGKGGALETVRNGETGLLFYEQSATGLAEAVRQFQTQSSQFSPNNIRESVAQFSELNFQSSTANFILEKWENRACG